MGNHSDDLWNQISPLLPDLTRFALSLTGDPHASQDLVQETILKVWEARARLNTRNLKSYLFTTLYHRFVDQLRGQKYLSSEPLSPENHPLQEAWEPSPWEEVDDQTVRQAVEELPSPFKEVVLLVDLMELSYQEVSQILNCPIGTVRSRLHRARLMLREKLKALAEAKGWTSGS